MTYLVKKYGVYKCKHSEKLSDLTEKFINDEICKYAKENNLHMPDVLAFVTWRVESLLTFKVVEQIKWSGDSTQKELLKQGFLSG